MRALLLATSILCAAPALSYAACPGTPANCPSPTYNNLTANTMTLGTSGTPGTGWFQGLGISDALTHMATTTLEFPSFAAFAAYKPSVITIALAWAGAPVVAHTAGYYAIGDGGSATYVWNSTSAATADGLYVITPGGSAGGRWFLQIPPGGTDIRALGVVVDGATSADVKLAAAVAACGTYGTVLFVPAGGVKLTGASSATSFIQDCAMTGVGIPAGGTTAQSQGSMFLISSTSVKPFTLGLNWRVEGVNFFHQGQTGAVVFPPVFSGDSVHTVGEGYMNNVTFVDTYDGVAQTNYNSGAPCPNAGQIVSSCPEGWVDVKFNNISIFGANDDFRWNEVADGITMSNVRFTPGPWLAMGGSNTAVGLAASTSRGVHAANPKDVGGQLNINMVNGTFVGLRYAWLVDSLATVAESQISATYDSVGTIVDTSSGGNWYGFTIPFYSSGASCSIPGVPWGTPNTGQASCFNMGAAAFNELVLTDFHSSGSQGDFITTAGTDVTLISSESLNIGSILATNPSAGEFYQVHITGATTPNVRALNNRLVGGSGITAHLHGITTTGSGIPNTAIIEGNSFDNLEDDITMKFPQGAIVSGNTSTNTAGTVSFVQSNTAAIIYYGNSWDKAPIPTIVPASCGTSPSAVSGGPNAGFWTTGSGSPTTCQIAMPLSMFGYCLFTSSDAVSIGAGPTGSPPTWGLTFSVAAASANVYYSCPGQQ